MGYCDELTWKLVAPNLYKHWILSVGLFGPEESDVVLSGLNRSFNKSFLTVQYINYLLFGCVSKAIDVFTFALSTIRVNGISTEKTKIDGLLIHDSGKDNGSIIEAGLMHDGELKIVNFVRSRCCKS